MSCQCVSLTECQGFQFAVRDMGLDLADECFLGQTIFDLAVEGAHGQSALVALLSPMVRIKGMFSS